MCCCFFTIEVIFVMFIVKSRDWISNKKRRNMKSQPFIHLTLIFEILLVVLVHLVLCCVKELILNVLMV